MASRKFARQKRMVVPSKKTEPVLSGKAEPPGPAGVVWMVRRARVAQLGTRLKARSEGGQVSWLDAVWCGAVGESFEASKPVVSGMGPPPKGASGISASLARMTRVLGENSCKGVAGSMGPEPGDVDPSTNRSATRAARGRGGCSWVGWTSVTSHDTKLTGLGNDSANGRSATQRQALGGSAGLSFMR
jgi:hypothetical protein